MTKKQVAELLKHSGKPMFRFLDDGSEYFISLYRPSLKDDSYLFLYEDDKLVSILLARNGIHIWETFFGKYKHTLPDATQFSKVIDALINESISLNGSLPGEQVKRDTIEMEERIATGGFLVEVGAVYFWIPGLSQALMAAGAVTIVSGEFGIDFTGSDDAEIMPDEYYNKFLDKMNNVGMDNTKEEIFNIVGRPHLEHSVDDTNLLIYKKQEITVYGLIDGKLAWIAFDYQINLKDQ